MSHIFAYQPRSEHGFETIDKYKERNGRRRRVERPIEAVIAHCGGQNPGLARDPIFLQARRTATL